ncbi:hypothetical protein [Arthrobacter sp. B3I4]|uniref:hypothetical protein n=1 Tax=Arthrobacter sp. B3I4 TaxID=3042267 RepID=UPI00277FAAB9|nr:hypothetical protein [Arthrobacter sp. B3I4]MDQ0754403.1 hypothetical protein [Arthrobacter sp. B3I4]
MDQSLNAQIKLDALSDVVRIDVRGSLNRCSRAVLIQLIQRIRRAGLSSHIRVDLASAVFVESSALAGLRHDLNFIDGNSAELEAAGAMPAPAGVSLDLQIFADDFGRVFQTVELPGEFAASVDPSGTRPLARFSDDELLAASDLVFGRLDDPGAVQPSELLAQYEDISVEMTLRESGRETETA